MKRFKILVQVQFDSSKEVFDIYYKRLHNELPNDLRGNREIWKYWENFKNRRWRESLVPSSPSKIKTLAVVLKNWFLPSQMIPVKLLKIEIFFEIFRKSSNLKSENYRGKIIT